MLLFIITTMLLFINRKFVKLLQVVRNLQQQTFRFSAAAARVDPTGQKLKQSLSILLAIQFNWPAHDFVNLLRGRSKLLQDLFHINMGLLHVHQITDHKEQWVRTVRIMVC